MKPGTLQKEGLLEKTPDEANDPSDGSCARCTVDIGLNTDMKLFIEIRRLHVEQMLVECVCIHDAPPRPASASGLVDL